MTNHREAPAAGAPSTPEPSAADALSAAGLSGIGLVVVLTGFALSIVDFFIVNVALTTIGRDLDGSETALELVVSGYGITYALGLVLGGRLGDAYGRRRLFILGLVAFTLSSALCGVAPNVACLVVARLLQGGAAALLVPQVLATIQAATQGQARARAISLYGATAGLAAVAGQILGGLLVSLDIAGAGWRSVFLINVPVGVAALLAVRHMPDTKADRKPGLDPVGTVLFGVALVCVLVVIVEGQSLGWPPWLWSLLVVAAAAVAALIRTERRLEANGAAPAAVPVGAVPLRHASGAGAMVPFSVGFGSLPLRLRADHAGRLRPRGARLRRAGLSPFAVRLLRGGAGRTPRISRAIGRRIVTVGAAVQGLGLLLMALLVGTTWPDVPLLARTRRARVHRCRPGHDRADALPDDPRRRPAGGRHGQRRTGDQPADGHRPGRDGGRSALPLPRRRVGARVGGRRRPRPAGGLLGEHLRHQLATFRTPLTQIARFGRIGTVPYPARPGRLPASPRRRATGCPTQCTTPGREEWRDPCNDNQGPRWSPARRAASASR